MIIRPARKAALWVLVAVFVLTTAYVPKAAAVSAKLALTSSMVTNESGKGDATMLVDEQSAAGDPKNGTGGSPTNQWFPGWGGSDHPSSAYIDLGQSYDLTDVYLRDVNASDNFVVSTGTPGSWTVQFTDGLGNYNAWNAHAVTVTTRYVRVTRTSQNANMSEIVLYGSPTGSGGGDATAPAAIGNLSSGTVTAASVSLNWTAPGDDGSTGTATSYDVRYSLSAINAGNWASATPATGEPTPVAAGGSQSFVVTGLSANTAYYFAVKTQDEVPNVSALSNVATATTAAAGGGSVKIALTSSMLVNESGKGDASLLVDEQATAGDPRAGTGGSPTSHWFPGYAGADHPSSVYVDLGQNFDLTDIYLRDINASGDFVVATGSPGSWTTRFTDGLTGYNSWNAHPVSVTTRYVRVTRATQGSNVSEIVLYGSPTGSGGGDTTAPSAITNLSAGTATSTSVPLSWTAPGDDGNTGTAAVYDIRYSTSTITSGNWSSAVQASGEPTPAAAGTSQSFTLTGLSANTTYYVAIRARDEAANESGLSNVASKTTAATGGSGGKIVLTASMLLNETQSGDPSKLIDEQSAAGDPKAGAGGTPSTAWDIGYNAIYVPASVVIDLGADYALTDFYLYDSGGSGNVVVSTGTPFSWTQQFTDNMSGFNSWKAHPVSTTTRYIQIVIPNTSVAVNELVIYGTQVGTPVSPPNPTAHVKPTMDQLIGINAFIDDPFAKIQVAGFVREYHNWNWDEGDLWNFGTIQTGYSNYPNNANKFNPSYAGGGWNFDAYYSGLKALGITVSPAIQGSVSWLSTDSNYKPISAGESALSPSSYAEHADHMYQFAARYGNAAVADAKLKLAAGQPRSTGLNTLSYFENWNEQDKWWKQREGYFNPYEYAAMSSADYDGHLGTMGNTVGVKNADPNAKMVMGGLADPKLEYIRALKFWSDFNRGGSFPFDVVNIHHYSNNGTNQTSGTAGISPEADGLKERLQKFTDYRNAYLPGKEVWITEFGYDTNQSSPQKVQAIGATSVQEVQADWIVRSYLAAAAAGIDKAAMYMLRDVDASSPTQFDSSGLTGSMSTGWAPKISWYYTYTLKNRLTGMRYLGEQTSGNANVKIYKFKSATTNQGAYVVWSPTSNNTTVSNYSLSLQGTPNSATLVTMANGDTDGVPSSLTISGGAVSVNVSERPSFVMVNDIQ
ncbi:fibronectin type III domain-containing protein [Cohnella lupini]|uniref:Putative glycosyl hydrolase n=1 Tax=Cohnella lupini TaxID=1294267 RepID=A0A3D9I4B9_9BACL|nr:fibronectin type III domain-containing protein [Cohnella lupini]RED56597.1 putative glycosyl hydrolase [Cohnella lupini]